MAKRDEIFQCYSCHTGRDPNPPDLTIYTKEYARHFEELDGSDAGWRLAYIRLGWALTLALPGALLLDFGCGTGGFLAVADKFYRAYGTDINPEAVVTAKRFVSSAEVCVGEVPIDRADILVAFDVLEHMEHPGKVIQRYDPAHVVVSTPWFGPSIARNLSRWHHYKPGEHLWLFSHWGLQAMLANLGYQIVQTTNAESFVRVAPKDSSAPSQRNILTVLASREELC